jgi:hypothetical protein
MPLYAATHTVEVVTAKVLGKLQLLSKFFFCALPFRSGSVGHFVGRAVLLKSK